MNSGLDIRKICTRTTCTEEYGNREPTSALLAARSPLTSGALDLAIS